MQGREFARGRLGGGEFGQILFKMATNLSDFRGQKIAFVLEVAGRKWPSQAKTSV